MPESIIGTSKYNATSTVQVEKSTKAFPIERGIRQSINSLSKVTLTLEDVLKNLHWDNRGIVDDIVLIAENPAELQALLIELERVLSTIGLKLKNDPIRAV